MKNLYSKILAVMKDVEYLKKDDDVKAGGSTYKAITEEKVTSAVGDSMRRHGLVIFPIDVVERREDMEVKRSSGAVALDRLTTVRVTYKIADPESGECETIMSVGTGIDTQDKGVGKAMTYAYKYALLRTFAIPTGEDPDKVASDDVTPTKAATAANSAPAQSRASGSSAKAAPPPTGKPSASPVITKAQLKELTDMCTDPFTNTKDESLAAHLKEIYTALGYEKASDIKQTDFAKVVSDLSGYILPMDL